MVTLADDKNRSNILKALDLAIFVKPYEEGDEEISQVWTETDGLVVPTGYNNVGWTTDGDTSWSRDQNWVDTQSHGASEPTRRDNTRDMEGLTFVGQETNRTMLELYRDADLSGLTPDADGNLRMVKGKRPAGRRYRTLAIGKDGEGPEAIYLMKWLPDSQVTSMSEQAWGSEQEIRYNVSLTAYTDEVFGTSMVEILGGPGLDHERMGFPAPAAG